VLLTSIEHYGIYSATQFEAFKRKRSRGTRQY